MIISSPVDYKKYAKCKLPPFLWHYLEGGSYEEYTLRKNIEDLAEVALHQRVLRDMSELNLRSQLFDNEPQMRLPVVLAPVGICGMYARRGEVQAAKAAEKLEVPFTLSSVSVCPIEEVVAPLKEPCWFQLYVLKDRGFMKNVLERAKAAGIKTLVFTVDMPTPGARYRDMHSGMSGPYRQIKRVLQAMVHPRWAIDVGLLGKPHDLGNISKYRGSTISLEDYIGYLTANFDPSITWKDLEWIRDYWQGNMIVKGVLDKQNAKDAVSFGASGIIVSNHGGRQLDGVLSSVRALPHIADAVKGDLKILVDGGIQNGLDVVRMLSLGADAAMIGRAYIYALACKGQAGVEHLLELFEKEMRVAMILTSAVDIKELGLDSLASMPKGYKRA